MSTPKISGRPPLQRRLMLLPGLTPREQQMVATCLHQIGRVAYGDLVGTFLDADVIAQRVLAQQHLVERSPAGAVREWARPLHPWAFGFAVGLRLGRACAPPQRKTKQWISEDYRALTEPARRSVGRYVRELLRIQREPARPLRKVHWRTAAMRDRAAIQRHLEAVAAQRRAARAS